VGLASLWVVALAALVAVVVLTAAPGLRAPYFVVLLACGARTLEAFARVRDLAAARKQALTDDLTQVGNRRLLYQRTEAALRDRVGPGWWPWSCWTWTGSRRSPPGPVFAHQQRAGCDQQRANHEHEVAEHDIANHRGQPDVWQRQQQRVDRKQGPGSRQQQT
jgi:hypothetical protein